MSLACIYASKTKCLREDLFEKSVSWRLLMFFLVVFLESEWLLLRSLNLFEDRPTLIVDVLI